MIIARYRINRFFYLLTGRGWSCIRVLISPLSFLVRPWFGHQQIHYEADVGIGMNILHPGLGLQISKRAIVGKNLLMAGGNAIGLRAQGSDARPVVGDNVEMGLGAIILGPVRIGNNVVIGAGAVVVDDVEDGKTVAGVPAREIS